ncbi:MAG: hypothetical protein H0V20_03100, partial [Actinobacteria bacterium]|nr:hypothetical protein [Actinomycetota bacterium]
MRLSRFLVFAGLTLIALTLPLAAAADHGTRPHTKNIHALGHSPHAASFFGVISAQRNINSDIAFWENYVIHGNYDGFRILRDAPGNPKEISWTHCNGDQGDIVVWENIVVRAWNSPAPAGRFCDGAPVPPGFEGVHIFDISNVEDPVLVGQLPLDCGSHTLTAIPDLALNRLIVYNQTSGGRTLPDGTFDPCNYITIFAVPLAAPGTAAVINKEPLMEDHACHDSGVILGSVNKMVCASGDMTNVFDIGANEIPGGSPEDPVWLFNIMEPGVCGGGSGDDVPCNGNWHSAAWSW